MLGARIAERLHAGGGIRVSLPGDGRLSIDRPLPFLCVHRRRVRRQPSDRLVTGQAAYLLSPTDDSERQHVAHLVADLAALLEDRFGGFLLVEIWEQPEAQRPPGPGFSLTGENLEPEDLDAWQEALGGIAIDGEPARVHPGAPAGESVRPPLLAAGDRRAAVGIAVEPIFRGPDDQLYPLVLLELESQLTRAVQRGLAAFARRRTACPAPAPHALAKSRIDRATLEVDRHLAATSGGFDFLLHATPSNGPAAWHQFERDRFQREPVFRYLPLPIDPEVSRRTLFGIPIERVEDPTLAVLIRNKHEELDRQISMLLNRGTRAFRYSGLQIYGEVDEELLSQAHRLLYRLPARSPEQNIGGWVDGKTMASHARAEIEMYQEAYPEFDAEVHLSDAISSGMLVSKNRLYVCSDWSAPLYRVRPLLQHEIGTHLVTYFTGRAQPLQLLRAGLAGYETLQEGLAVLAEYLVGGLTSYRLRVLAARVIACKTVVDGATFIDTFRLLSREFGFGPRQSFFIALRVHRGGGLVKDAIYLRGLARLLDYLAGGGAIEHLYLGKVALDQIAEVIELHERGILQAPPVMPRFLEDEAVRERLRELRGGSTVLDLARG